MSQSEPLRLFNYDLGVIPLPRQIPRLVLERLQPMDCHGVSPNTASSIPYASKLVLQVLFRWFMFRSGKAGCLQGDTAY